MATAIDPGVHAQQALGEPGLGPLQASSGDTSLVILQSLLCLLRERNILTRADVEDLADRVRARAEAPDSVPLACCSESAKGAAALMGEIDRYLGQRYGGKHRRFS